MAVTFNLNNAFTVVVLKYCVVLYAVHWVIVRTYRDGSTALSSHAVRVENVWEGHQIPDTCFLNKRLLIKE